MVVAIPVEKGILSGVFNRTDSVDFYEVDLEAKKATYLETVKPFVYGEPADMARLMLSRGTKVMILGGIVCKLKSYFEKQGLELIPRTPSWHSSRIAQLYANGNLPTVLV